jgi:serine/threonine protein kinase, bacterial
MSQSAPAGPPPAVYARPCNGEAVLSFSRQIRSSTPGAFGLYAGAEPSPGYRLRRVRGRGGFAEVWEADSPSGTPVALKFMPSSNATTTSREVRSIQSFLPLYHPHLVKTHEVWSVPGYIVINMELAEATLLDLMLLYHNDLAQYIEPPLLCRYIWQVGEALDFLNGRRHVRDGRKVGFQHGDVKPNNVLLVGENAKLTDHGLATPTHGPMTPCPRQGTREYAPPEVFNGYLSDTSDQFSLAVTYHVLRTGTFPFPPPPLPLPKNFARPPAYLGLVTDGEQGPLARALSPVPQDRYPSCRDFMTDILRVHRLKAVRNEQDEWAVVKDASQDSSSVKPAHRPPASPDSKQYNKKS